MATHSSILAWRISWTEEAGGPVHGVAKSRTQLGNLHFHLLPLFKVLIEFVLFYVLAFWL